MTVQVHDLLRLIGQLYVENALLRQQLEQARQGVAEAREAATAARATAESLVGETAPNGRRRAEAIPSRPAIQRQEGPSP